MTDVLAAITTAVSSVKVATDIAKMIKNADHSLETAELNLQIAEIIGALADAKIALAETNDSAREKEAEIQRLKDLLSFKENLVRVKEGYYELNDNSEPFGYPFCQHCWEVKKIPVHLSYEGRRIAKCPSCKNEYRYDHVEIIG